MSNTKDAEGDAEIAAYIPTTDEVRERYSTDDDGNEYWSTQLDRAEFDRWLAGVWDQAKAVGILQMTAPPHTYDAAILENPYRHN